MSCDWIRCFLHRCLKEDLDGWVGFHRIKYGQPVASSWTTILASRLWYLPPQLVREWEICTGSGAQATRMAS